MSLLLPCWWLGAHTAIRQQLQQQQAEEAAQVDALLASQKHLTSNLRTLINGAWRHGRVGSWTATAPACVRAAAGGAERAWHGASRLDDSLLHVPASPGGAASHTGLDQVLQLAAPKFNNAQADQLATIAARARGLQSKLSMIAGRVQRMQVRAACAG